MRRQTHRESVRLNRRRIGDWSDSSLQSVYAVQNSVDCAEGILSGTKAVIYAFGSNVAREARNSCSASFLQMRKPSSKHSLESLQIRKSSNQGKCEITSIYTDYEPRMHRRHTVIISRKLTLCLGEDSLRKNSTRAIPDSIRMEKDAIGSPGSLKNASMTLRMLSVGTIEVRRSGLDFRLCTTVWH